MPTASELSTMSSRITKLMLEEPATLTNKTLFISKEDYPNSLYETKLLPFMISLNKHDVENGLLNIHRLKTRQTVKDMPPPDFYFVEDDIDAERFAELYIGFANNLLSNRYFRLKQYSFFKKSDSEEYIINDPFKALGFVKAMYYLANPLELNRVKGVMNTLSLYANYYQPVIVTIDSYSSYSQGSSINAGYKEVITTWDGYQVSVSRNSFPRLYNKTKPVKEPVKTDNWKNLIKKIK